MLKLNKGDTLMATSEKGKFQQKDMITLETKQLVEINASLFSKMQPLSFQQWLENNAVYWSQLSNSNVLILKKVG